MYYSADAKWLCDFQTWVPPLQDEDFGQDNLNKLILSNIDGTLPAGVIIFIFTIQLTLFYGRNTFVRLIPNFSLRNQSGPEVIKLFS